MSHLYIHTFQSTKAIRSTFELVWHHSSRPRDFRQLESTFDQYTGVMLHTAPFGLLPYENAELQLGVWLCFHFLLHIALLYAYVPPEDWSCDIAVTIINGHLDLFVSTAQKLRQLKSTFRFEWKFVKLRRATKEGLFLLHITLDERRLFSSKV